MPVNQGFFEIINHFKIKFINGGVNDEYDDSKRTIYWDHRDGGVFKYKKVVTSAALALAHEMGHAAQHLDGQINKKVSRVEKANLRRRNLNARWIAGNLFAASVYLIYLAVQIIVNGAIGTLGGWNLSAQMLWFHCLHNITLGEGLLIMFFGGLLGALVIGNIVMLFSIKLKNVKLAAVFSVIAVLLIRQTANMEGLYGTIELFSPMYFEEDSLILLYLFVGNVAVPYFVAVSVVSVLYVAVLYAGMRLSYKKYATSGNGLSYFSLKVADILASVHSGFGKRRC